MNSDPHKLEKETDVLRPLWLVCVKQVQQEPVFKKSGDSFQMDRERVEGILNPCDRLALDTAKGLKSAAGGTVVALSMGPPMAEEVLREALALGADRAILLTDPAFAGADTLATAQTLAAAVRRLGGFDLILCGARSLDSDTGQVGPQVAELLDLPMAAYVDVVSCQEGTIRVERQLDGTRERLSMRLPALITVESRTRGRETVSLHSLEQAFRDHSVTRWSLKDLKVDPACVGWEGSATRAREYALLKRKRAGEVVDGGAGEAADRILEVLLEKNLLDR
jgi:electron transfer flavoprotein beta subunit